jgi:hypothetical protein
MNISVLSSYPVAGFTLRTFGWIELEGVYTAFASPLFHFYVAG